MNAPDPNSLDALVRDVQSTSKYRTVCDAVIRNIGKHELSIRKSYKEAVKETRNTLHQVAGAYLRGRMRYDRWIDELSASIDDPDALKDTCRKLMQYHASTRERLSIIPEVYEKLFETIPSPHTIVDIGCGLNPLSIPWMPVSGNTVFHVFDLYTDQADFLNRFFALCNLSGHASAVDIGATLPDVQADLALLFKVLPLMDHLPHTTPERVIRNLDAEYIAVSFPVHSLSGRDKGMATHYTQRFEEMIQNESWQVEQISFESELIFVVQK